MDGVLRVISGPHTGACYVLGKRTRLGRAADADVQLADSHVSRHHARIVQLADGGFELTDLSSKIGTMVNGAQVERHRLELNDVVTIGSSVFAFELTAGEVTAKGFESKTRGFEALRPTQPLPAVSGEPPAPQRPQRAATSPNPPTLPRTMPRPSPAVEARPTPWPTQQATGTPTPAAVRRSTERQMPTMPETPRTSESRPRSARDAAIAAQTVELGATISSPPVVERPKTPTPDPSLQDFMGPGLANPTAPAESPIGQRITTPKPSLASELGLPTFGSFGREGDLGSSSFSLDAEARDAALKVLRDVLDYRALRLDELRGAALQQRAQRRYEELTMQLLVDTLGLPASRRFVRIPCPLPATLTQRDGNLSRTLEIVLEDLSAGGARLYMHDPSVRVGDEVWLAFDLAALFSFGQKVVFRSRVVWTSPGLASTGLMFGGNARFVDSIDAAIRPG